MDPADAGDSVVSPKSGDQNAAPLAASAPAQGKLGWFGAWRAKRREKTLRRLAADPALASLLSKGQHANLQATSSRDKADEIKAPSGVLFAGLALLFGVGSVKAILPHYSQGSNGEFWAEVLPLFVAEVGVALMVAYIIGWAIDAQAKRKEERDRIKEKLDDEKRRLAEQEEAIEREQRLVQDVFRGVLGIRHSSAYVRKVIETTLEQRVIRKTVSLIYTLRRLSEAEAERIGDLHRFLVMDQAMSYEFQNLSTEETDVDIIIVVPFRQGPKLRHESKLVTVSIGDKPLSQDEVTEGEEVRGDALCYKWRRTLPPHAKLPVAAKVRLIKEESDTEVWCSYYPCSEGMTLQVVAPDDLHMGIRNNTASGHKVETDPSDNGVGVWKIEGAILPNDSVVFYWRTPEDDGEIEAEVAGAAAPMAPPVPVPAPWRKGAVDSSAALGPEAPPSQLDKGTREGLGD